MKSNSNIREDKLKEINEDLARFKMLKIVSGVSAALSTGIAGTSIGVLIASGIKLAPNASTLDKVVLCCAALISSVTAAFAVVNVSRAKTDINDIKTEEADLKKEKKEIEKAI